MCGKNKCGKGKYWGWALRFKDTKKDVSCTHFVCLGVDDKFNPKIIYIIPADKHTSFPQGVRQFKKIEHGFIANTSDDPVDLNGDIHDEWKDFIRACDKNIKNQDAIKLKENEKLVEVLEKR